MLHFYQNSNRNLPHVFRFEIWIMNERLKNIARVQNCPGITFNSFLGHSVVVWEWYFEQIQSTWYGGPKKWSKNHQPLVGCCPVPPETSALKAPPVHYWDLIANIHPQVNNNNKYIFWQHSTWENSADSCVGGINAESTTFLTATDPLTLPGAFCWVAISYFIQEFWPCWICSYFYFWACTIIPWYMLFRTSKHCAPLTIMTQYRNSFFKQSLILDIWNMTTQIYHTLQWFMFHKPMVSSELRLCLLQFCRHTITINNALIWVAATWKEISDTIFSLNTLGSSQKRHQGSPNWSSKRSPCMYST